MSTSCAIYCKNTFIILRCSFFGFLLSQKFKMQNVNLVNRLSNSICMWSVVLFPLKLYVRTVRARSNRSKLARKTKYSIQSTHCHVCRRRARLCLIISSLLMAYGCEHGHTPPTYSLNVIIINGVRVCTRAHSLYLRSAWERQQSSCPSCDDLSIRFEPNSRLELVLRQHLQHTNNQGAFLRVEIQFNIVEDQ